ncbi:MAG: BamA/TamA family outer membrane protein [Syntrophobacterales bacterium]
MITPRVAKISSKSPSCWVGALILGWIWLLAQETASKRTPLILQSFEIVGAETINARKLKKQMTMPLPSIWPWRKKPEFRKDNLEADIAQLKAFYRTEGFYHAQITYDIHQHNGKVDVILYIQEGPPIKVTGIEVKGAEVIYAGELAKIESPLAVGDRYSDSSYAQLKTNYINYLQNHGYFRGKVTGKVYLDDQKNTAKIVFNIHPGPLCYFGKTTVKGAVKTPNYLILRKLAFKTGEIFSLKKIFESQKNLYDTDLFRSATVTPEDEPKDLIAIPITVQVQEKKRRSLRVGLGYGDEELLRARLGLRIRNVAGGGRMLDLDTKYSSIDSHIIGTFTSPQIFKSYFDFVALAGVIRRDLPSFTDRSYYSQARLEHDLPWKFRGYFGHAFEYARPFDVPLSTLILLQETEPGRLYKSSMIIFGVSQDTTVNPSDPTGGGKITLGGESALDFLGSNLEFYRTIAEVRRYQSITKKVVLSGRLKFGIIQPIQSTIQIPIQRRFFSGGYNSVRGYRLDYLGPRTPNGDPLGGDAVIEGNLQGRVPVYKQFRAVGFMDFGNVYFTAADIDLGQLKYAAGFGFTYVTPIGPVGIYFAWPLNPIDPSVDTFRVHFTIGPSF